MEESDFGFRHSVTDLKVSKSYAAVGQIFEDFSLKQHLRNLTGQKIQKNRRENELSRDDKIMTAINSTTTLR